MVKEAQWASTEFRHQVLRARIGGTTRLRCVYKMKTQRALLEPPSLCLTGTAVRCLFLPLSSLLSVHSASQSDCFLWFTSTARWKGTVISMKKLKSTQETRARKRRHESTQRQLPCSVTAAFPKGNPGFSLEKLFLYQRLVKMGNFPWKSQSTFLLFSLLLFHTFLKF